MTCTSSIITNVQQDDKSTDGDVAHHLESSTAPKDDQRCVWNPLTVRAGRIFGTSKHVRYSEYSEHEKEPNNPQQKAAAKSFIHIPTSPSRATTTSKTSGPL